MSAPIGMILEGAASIDMILDVLGSHNGDGINLCDDWDADVELHHGCDIFQDLALHFFFQPLHLNPFPATSVHRKMP